MCYCLSYPMTAAHQAPLSTGSPRQENWSSRHFLQGCLSYSANVGWAIFLLPVALAEVTGWYSAGGWDGLEGPRQLHSNVWCFDRVSCKVGFSGISQLSHLYTFSNLMVSGWSDTLCWFRAPRKKKLQTDGSSFSNLDLEIDIASLTMCYVGQSSCGTN